MLSAVRFQHAVVRLINYNRASSYMLFSVARKRSEVNLFHLMCMKQARAPQFYYLDFLWVGALLLSMGGCPSSFVLNAV